MSEKTSKGLYFSEAETAHLLSASKRVGAIAPQIRWYRSEGFGWPVIKASLEAIGIDLGIQSLKNVVSSCPDREVSKPQRSDVGHLGQQSFGAGFEPARPRRANI